MERFSNNDIKMLEEAYTDVQMYNEGMWDRVKASASGLKQSAKNLGSNTKAKLTNKFDNLKAKGTAYAKGAASKLGSKVFGDESMKSYKQNITKDYHDKVKSNNQNLKQTINTNNAKVNTAKLQSLYNSYSKKLNSITQDFEKDVKALNLNVDQKYLTQLTKQCKSVETMIKKLLKQ